MPSLLTTSRYWIDQIGAVSDTEGTKPIVVVGTHADFLSKPELATKVAEMNRMFPTPTTWERTENQIMGHYAISLAPGEKKNGLSELKARLIDIAFCHPKIGIGKVEVPRDFVVLQNELESINALTPYLYWQEYVALGATISMLLCPLLWTHAHSFIQV